MHGCLGVVFGALGRLVMMARVRFVVYVAEQVLHFHGRVVCCRRTHLLVHLKSTLRIVHRGGARRTQPLQITAAYQASVHVGDLAVSRTRVMMHLDLPRIGGRLLVETALASRLVEVLGADAGRSLL